MKLNLTTIIVIVIMAPMVASAMIVQEGSSAPDCLEVAHASVRAYYEPAFEAALVGWFIEGEPLKLKRIQGNWALVSGSGTDAALRKARMTGWVQRSYLVACGD